ncbi:MAG: Xaa-Pro peptidase family protein [Chloroflexota bacterium]
MINQDRLERLKQEMKAQNIDGIALVPGPNMEYMSHIHSHLSERPIVLFLPVNDDPTIVIPNLEAMKAEAVGIPSERIHDWRDDEGYMTAFMTAANQLKLSNFRLGVEALHMRVLELDILQKVAPGLKTVHAESVMSALRLVKDAEEIAAMERAIAVAQEAMEKLLPSIKIGQTEKEIAARLTQLLMDGGADSIAFGPIVSAGPNAASPHATPTERPLQAGDLLVIDWGCYVDGYPSDITRTFAVGDIDDEAKRIYNAVKIANEQGKLASGPTSSGQDVDRASREVIEEAGYGEYFIHRTGHGLGLEVHEPPFMMEGNETIMDPGNVITVEPGIYLPGKNGVRIEDDVVITKDGYRSMTTFPRELITVG